MLAKHSEVLAQQCSWTKMFFNIRLFITLDILLISMDSATDPKQKALIIVMLLIGKTTEINLHSDAFAALKSCRNNQLWNAYLSNINITSLVESNKTSEQASALVIPSIKQGKIPKGGHAAPTHSKIQFYQFFTETPPSVSWCDGTLTTEHIDITPVTGISSTPNCFYISIFNDGFFKKEGICIYCFIIFWLQILLITLQAREYDSSMI